MNVMPEIRWLCIVAIAIIMSLLIGYTDGNRTDIEMAKAGLQQKVEGNGRVIWVKPNFPKVEETK